MSNIADTTRSRTTNPSLLSIDNTNTDPNEDNAYSNDNVNDSQHQDYLGRVDTEQNVDEEFISTYIKVITSTTQDHTASLPNIPLNVATQVHIQNLLDSIVNFNGTNEDIRAWIQRIELLFDLADYTKFKWIKLTALHLTDDALF
ncbi:unnamed protein product [Didymodactylos carnosus]|uniref:Uncharacterized protein n=1 Tax=Didymodactylos carnosus TaxID=1234261 RepID=A0A815IDW5_9BILA|nr:unnamed protein product [Didymodactylos carnosus]CAF4250388.1 unnamed protein product [Didymodactylos carnosus]